MDVQNMRPPVVAIMGHVDHGKTTLLDFLRKSNVVAKEHGGITQHLGAYQVVTAAGRKITFLDTPGHAAFEHIRRRGGEVADIVILVIASDDGIMPQTREAINHIKRSGAAMIVAFNKIDLPNADVDRIKGQLAEEGIMVESYGGDVVSVEISAKQGKNVDTLLEMIELVADLKELKDESKEPVLLVALESRMDKGGPEVSVLVKRGTLKLGTPVFVNDKKGTIRTMTNDRGARVDAAENSAAVEVLGMPQAVTPGSLFVEKDGVLTHTEGLADLVVRDVARMPSMDSGLIFGAQNAVKQFPVIIRADVSGSLEAILENLPSRDLIQIVEASVGEVSDRDVERAEAIRASIYSFNVKTPSRAKKLSDSKKVPLKEYSIIYKLLDEFAVDLTTFLEEPETETVVGKGDIIRVFSGSNGVTIGGVKVIEGSLNVNSRVRIVRGGSVVAEGTIISAKHLKDDVKRLDKGAEGGIVMQAKQQDNPFLFEEGDIIEQIRLKT